MPFSLRGVITTAAILLLAGNAVAEPVSMRFNVYVSGLRVMKVKFDGDIGKTTYSGHARMRPKGFARLFMKKKLDMKVQGRFNDAHPRPVSFWMKSRKKKKEKTASLSWGSGLVPSWSRKPPASAMKRKAINAAIAKGAIDPLSMLFGIARRNTPNPCAGKLRIFDGNHVYDMRLAKVGNEAVRNMNYSGPALKCRLIYVPVAGMSAEKKRKGLKNPPAFTVWLARVKSAENGSVYLPVQAAGKLKGRPFTASLGDASLGGRPLRAMR